MRTQDFGIAVPALLAVSMGVQVWRDQGWQAYEPPTAVTWLQAGPALERGTLGFKALVADVYWIRAVVYYGRQRLSTTPDKTYDLLYPYLNLVTSLDPRFTVAYRFGAIFLSQQYPDGPGRPDQAIELLQRGIEHDPSRWEYPHDIGFVHYFDYRDYRTAAEWLGRASRVPGAPGWLTASAAMTLARGGDRDSSRMLWRHVYESAEASAIKETAIFRLQQLETFDFIDAVNQAVWRYEARAGHFPASWNELIAAGVLRGLPADSTGAPLVLDPVNEDVRIAKTSALNPLPPDHEMYGQ